MRHDDFHGTKRSLGRNRSTAANCRGRVPRPAAATPPEAIFYRTRRRASAALSPFRMRGWRRRCCWSSSNRNAQPVPFRQNKM